MHLPPPRHTCRLPFYLLLLPLLSLSLSAQEPDTPAQPIEIREAFVTAPPRSGGRARVSIAKDLLEAASLEGKLLWPDPTAEATSPSSEGIDPWRKLTADPQGGFSDRALAGGWMVAYVNLPKEGIWMLEAQGHGSVRINDAPRVGDVYSNGTVVIPTLLQPGQNRLVFTGGRGRISARLTAPSKPLSLSLRDTTLPHLIRQETDPLWGSLMLAIASPSLPEQLAVRTSGDYLLPSTTAVPPTLPMTIRKIPFSIAVDPATWKDLPESTASLKVKIELIQADAQGAEDALDAVEVDLPIRSSDTFHRRTFVSQIDGSVQYYAVHPPAIDPATDRSKRPAMVLTLHGAGVEGEGQAASYAPKTDMVIAGATNRRPFGFDWEDWGRLDALEVLEQASSRFQTDPARCYLTGHSMGGHGTWHIGSLYPDRFAAIAPSAGWISFSTYAGGPPPQQPTNPVTEILRRSTSGSDTLDRVRNLAAQGVYILHGDQDDNVPVDQARQMREELSKFHPDFVYKEQPGAGHWWGNLCVDWPPIFRFFADHQIPTSVRSIDFTTPAPHLAPRCHWATIEQQIRPGDISRIQLSIDPKAGKLSGTTNNVQLLRLATESWQASPESNSVNPATLEIDLDSQSIRMPWPSESPQMVLRRDGELWRVVESPEANAAEKNSHRSGFFKEAFRRRFVLVYGTQGTDEENRTMRDRVRFDAETFWYRGNGSVDCIADTQWQKLADEDRNVIVYGNASINLAWRQLLGNSPIVVERDRWSIDGKESEQTEASVLMVRPRADSPHALVGAIGGTSPRALRATLRLPIFSSGTGYPDYLVLSPKFLSEGSDAVLATGFFNADWSLDKSQ
jgi:poly(3-hydroxybutyrate) depolymerase